MAEVILGTAALQRRLRAISVPVGGQKIMNRLGLSTVREAKILVHRKTGNLGRSIHIARSTPISVTVQAGARYAGWVEFGTRAHIIRPRGRVLAWPATAAGRRLTGSARSAMFSAKGAAKLGGWRYARLVHHPGTKPYPFLMPGARLAVSKSGLKDLVIQEWNEAA